MSKTVLIVEDNELNMKLFHDLVKSLGLNVLQTRNGMEALSLVREHKPDLVIMDIQLPEVSGIEVTSWIKADPTIAKTPVLAVTAFAMKGDEDRIRASGCDGYLSKPIAIASFLQTVKSFVGL
jgi:two-component system, cell cycle response regulator DivK